MHVTKHIIKATPSGKVVKSLKNLESIRTSIHVYNRYLFFLFLIFIFL